jgi:hypothetical protein
MRIETVLAPNQSIVVSTAREAGAAPGLIEISRRNDLVLVNGAVTH